MADPVNFALNPSRALGNELIDYSTEIGKSIYERSTKNLFPKGQYYDLDPEEMYLLLQLLEDRADEYGWNDNPNGIMWIPENPEDVEVGYPDNIIEKYGSISMERIQAWEDVIYAGEDVSTQHTYLLYHCLMNTLSLGAKAKVKIHRDDYIRDENRCGLALLKSILGQSHLDSKATITAIRASLSSLDTYILTINCDITKFNDHVSMLVRSLNARDENTQDLLTNLFKAYAVTKDQTFVKYIEHKKSGWEDGTINLTAPTLMRLAEEKYKNLKQQGQWEAPSELEEKIIALEAKLLRKDKPKPKPGKPGKGSSTKSGEKPKWLSKNLAPKKNELTKTRQWSGHDWHWCSEETGGKCPGMWRRHNPKSCEGWSKPKDKPDTRKRERSQKDRKHKLRVTKALKTIIEDDDDHSALDDTDSDE